MKIDQVLQRLSEHNVSVGQDSTDHDGTRVIIVGCSLPSFPYGPNRFAYATIVLGPGQDEVHREERDAIRRRLHHLTTDIFGDDASEYPELFERREAN